MNSLNKKAIVELVRMPLILAAALFIPVWTFDYWQAWVLLIVFSLSAIVISVYLMKHDPALLARRIKGLGSENEASQKIIQIVAAVIFISLFIIPSIDHRFGWSTVPMAIVIVGNIFVLLGFFIVYLVFKENTYTSAIIEIAAEQKVISTGPYALVRHPMYGGALIMLFGIPLALGSWWGLFAFYPMLLVIVWRLLDEEIFLAKNLPGYEEYTEKVKYHLIPHVW
ncbi:isoprenylcysteine carboxylmethyltransferase family protein [Glaciimonas sp. GS1]|uniref:Isoprenylcysteine carboxylmethyltransferase family protein n=2 Tax=Glaciimonas soli TaxID=2590999 RepID=A0A843YP07_9BURK|nr:isoprenylcysteine carboxylmethyltransferase family protein [Glaciimonas soli]